MNEFAFKEEDKTKLIEFLNIVAKNATFNMKTDEIISYFKLLSYMQNTMIPKINANILEVVRVEQAKEEPKEKVAKTREPKAAKSE